MEKLKDLNDLMKRITTILKKIEKDEKICVIHHDDSDGCSSAALLSIIVQNSINEYPIFFPVAGSENVKKSLMNKLKTLKPDHVFVFDVMVRPMELSGFKGFILDHHIFKDVEQRKDMPYLNPRSFEKEENEVVPVSYIMYKVIEKLFTSEKVAWMAGIGVTEDHRVDTCKDLFEDVKDENPELLKVKEINQRDVESSLFGELSDMIRSGRMVKGVEGARTATLALVECKDRPDKLINGLTQHSLALRRFYERFTHETQGCMRDVERRGTFVQDKKVVMYEQKRSRLSGMTSFVADEIRKKFPEWIAYVINKQHRKGEAKISIRLEQNKRSENLASIIENIKGELPSVKGGGHKAAVGVVLNLEDASSFSRKFLDSID